MPNHTIEIIGSETVTDVDALAQERERLLARIAEIDLILNPADRQEVATINWPHNLSDE